jgi:hypothetical protein
MWFSVPRKGESQNDWTYNLTDGERLQAELNKILASVDAAGGAVVAVQSVKSASSPLQ